ncbi:MAG: alpha/beta fold hydrolase [Eubacteriales bacterium]|nr:alpha/beta fold hydrolase [Eubacteriales bacterium]
MRKKTRRILVGILLVLIALAAMAGVYVSDYYHAGDTAAAIQKDESIVVKEQNWLYLKAKSDEIGLIFYPGAKVEYSAYLPLMKNLQEKNINCFLVKMPGNLAILGSNRGEQVIEAHPEIQKWYLGGHSMGGAFASSYASKHSEKISGVILLGAYLYGDYPVEQSVTIYGEQDQVLNRSKITYEENVHVLAGGNHAQFGDYGEQKGDGTASITPEEQWTQTTEWIIEFLRGV